MARKAGLALLVAFLLVLTIASCQGRHADSFGRLRREASEVVDEPSMSAIQPTVLDLCKVDPACAAALAAAAEAAWLSSHDRTASRDTHGSTDPDRDSTARLGATTAAPGFDKHAFFGSGGGDEYGHVPGAGGHGSVDERTTSLRLKVVAALVLFLEAIAGMYLPLALQRLQSPQWWLSLLNCFSGGIFLAAGMIHLLPHCAEAQERLGPVGPGGDYPLYLVLVVVGYCLVFFVERVLFDVHGEGHTHCQHSNVFSHSKYYTAMSHKRKVRGHGHGASGNSLASMTSCDVCGHGHGHSHGHGPQGARPGHAPCDQPVPPLALAAGGAPAAQAAPLPTAFRTVQQQQQQQQQLPEEPAHAHGHSHSHAAEDGPCKGQLEEVHGADHAHGHAHHDGHAHGHAHEHAHAHSSRSSPRTSGAISAAATEDDDDASCHSMHTPRAECICVAVHPPLNGHAHAHGHGHVHEHAAAAPAPDTASAAAAGAETGSGGGGDHDLRVPLLVAHRLSGSFLEPLEGAGTCGSAGGVEADCSSPDALAVRRDRPPHGHGHGHSVHSHHLSHTNASARHSADDGGGHHHHHHPAAAAAGGAAAGPQLAVQHSIRPRFRFMHGAVLLAALALHTALECIALGLMDERNNFLVLFAAIASHKAVSALALSSRFLKEGATVQQVTAYVGPFCLVAPTSVMLGVYIGSVAPLAHLVLGCFATGTFLYVGASEVIMEEFEGEMRADRRDISTRAARYIKFGAVLAAVAFVAGITLLPEPDHH